jgi:flavorubredoxin
METRVTEVGDGIHQLTTRIPGFELGFNQYLIGGDEPALFHTGMRSLFPSVSEAIGRVVPLDSLRWITFGHIEADESGAMNQFLAAAPRAEVAHGFVGCMVSLGDLADRPPRALADGEVLETGGHSLRWIDTPHVPHGWEAGLIFDETTGTLLCGDLFTQWGDYDATDATDVVGPALEADARDDYGSWSLHPETAATIRRLVDLEPTALALMHGPTFVGDGGAQLRQLADAVEARVARQPATVS